MKVLITGANGFLGRNLVAHLGERPDVEVSIFLRSDPLDSLSKLVAESDFIFHLAGINRPKDSDEFAIGNTGLTERICELLREREQKVPVLFTSSIQAELDNAYGTSKLAAEQALVELEREAGCAVHIYRLPNVFGKWSRPNYNSAVATFCYSIANDLPIQINDPDALVSLVYVDDVIVDFLRVMDEQLPGVHRPEISNVYSISVGDLALQINAFKDSRESMVTEAVGYGLTRALYSTYLSFLRPEQFSYEVPKYEDPRGVFVEMLKTHDSGQFSYFTAHPGVTRGGHYHHTKTEKFLVIKGEAHFRFHHITTGDFYELYTCGKQPEIVETVPGWSHDITNTGDDEMIVMLWANEIFDRENPDTYAKCIKAAE
jgi:UDP-2-acetamido-2,6-beta-L-arabino-hexul-4-ose reductase